MVAETVRIHGPFHGIIGFSQGAAFAALICLQAAIRRYTEMDKNIQLGIENQINDKEIPFPLELDTFKFAILFSGFRSHSSRHSYLYKVYANNLKIKM